ncbi:glycosyltransferase family 2 protein [Rossellomorea aquimaris]|jgi:cellulose synthase/poly-beta-1,6-N-acetylglucosamine synthase-like glycosyltransferase|uniref:glycosyltransferase n=1 Tax=Rossellomorea aquimaris TaxID=189382 RepID=UPI0011E935C8|nr:glycosyltransferase family 2 protein [Rossellomorea aquimaris]TYS91788.1 glycosyltransferase family 2 protein [Rossellomorea aquimaris]
MNYYILITLIFVLVTFINLLFLPKLSSKLSSNDLVSVLVPMRNEERNVRGLIANIKKITHSHVEFIILDDGSTDRTKELLYQLTTGDSRFKVVNGKPLPKGWVGKVHACKELSKHAGGTYYLFLDADVRVSPSIIEKVLFQMKHYNAGLVTGFPQFPIPTLLSKMLVPFQHFLVYFHLPIGVANHTTNKAFTAAHGAFMFFKKEAYEDCGGHEAVKSSLLEDVHIARKVKEKGWKVTIVNNTYDVTCHMYDTNREVWEGFLKNIYIGLGRNPISVFLLSLFYFVFYILPLPLFLYGLMAGEGSYCVPLVAIWVQTLLIDITSNQSRWHFLIMPVASISFIIIMWASMLRGMKKQGYAWKGRTYS